MKNFAKYLSLVVLLSSGTAFAQSATQGHIPGTPDPVFGTDTIGGSTDHAKDQAPIPTYSSAVPSQQQASLFGWQGQSGGGTDAQSNNAPIPAYASVSPLQQQASVLDWQSRSGGGTDAQSNNVPVPSYGAPFVAERAAPTQSAQVGEQAAR